MRQAGTRRWTGGRRGLTWRIVAAALLVAPGVGDTAGAGGKGVVALQLQRARLEAAPAGVSGLSGLDRDESGRLLAVTERTHLLVPLELDGARGSRVAAGAEPRRLEGVPAGLELESLALLPGGLLAVGTETQAQRRAEDLVLLARLEPDSRAVVTDTVAMPYAPWQLEAGRNHGIEGLCAAGGVLVAGSEAVGTYDGRRFAPLGRYELEGRRWTAFRLGLTSDAGRLAALACRPAQDGWLEVLAVERQFGVSRLLRFELELAGPGGNLEPRIVADFAELLDTPPVLEGVVWLEDGRIALVSDNDGAGVRGPTELVVLEP